MLIDVKFTATKSTVRVCSQLARFDETVANQILLDTATKIIYAIGRTAQEIEHDSPQTWAQRPSTFEFYPIYDVDNFKSHFVEVVLIYYAFAMQHIVRRSFWAGFMGRFDRFCYDLWLEGYDRIDMKQRHLFEQGVYALDRQSVKQVTVNRQVIERKMMFWAFRRFKSKWFAR